MKTQDNYETRDKLDKILWKLSASLEILEKEKEKGQLIQEFKDIYNGPKGTLFCPYYTDIFSTLSSIDTESKSERIGILAKNLDIVENYFEAVTPSDQNSVNAKKDEIIANKILELCDLIRFEIEIESINRTNNSIRNAHSKILELEARLNSVKQETIDASKHVTKFVNASMKDIKQRMERFQEQCAVWQREHVTILGIFAAIVLGFTGDIAFSRSVLENINNMSLGTGVIVALIIGMVFFDIVYLLVYFIRQIINRNDKHDKNGEAAKNSEIAKDRWTDKCSEVDEAGETDEASETDKTDNSSENDKTNASYWSHWKSIFGEHFLFIMGNLIFCAVSFILFLALKQ